MGKRPNNYKKRGSDKNTGEIDYDEDMGRKAVGNLLSDIDEDNDAEEITAADKPVVRAIRINSQKIKKEKISTSFYDEDRVNRNGDAIVTGFKDDEEPEPLEEVVEEEAISPLDEEDPADAIRIRRPNIFKDESDEDHMSRERYRKQFLDGYTDHERKRLDLPSTAYDEEPKRRLSEPSARRAAIDNSDGELEVSRRRRLKDDSTMSRDDAPIQSSRPRRARGETDEEVTLITKRREQRERSSNTASGQAQPIPSGAPIFKIFTLVFVIMLAVIVVLIININSANATIRELEAVIVQFDEDVNELTTLRAQFAAVNTQLDSVTNERNQLLSQIEELERQAQVAGTDAGGVPGVGDGADEGATEGLRRHTVAPGDSLYRISVTFFGHGRAVEAIRLLNDLPDTNVMVGDVLYIPDSYQ